MHVIEQQNVLTTEQCERLIVLFGKNVLPSRVGGTQDSRILSPARTSSSSKIERTSLPLDVQTDLVERVAALCGLPVENQERWEIIRYNVGEHFAPHYDFIPTPGADGQRLFSVVVILQAPELGGATAFPVLGLSFEPDRGKLLLWPNTDLGGRKHAALHASTPVLRGTKWSLVTWVRANRVQGMGGSGGSTGTGG